MFDILNTLYMLLYWNNIQAFCNHFNGDQMKRCPLDGLFGCEHNKAKTRLPLTSCSTNSDVIVGDEMPSIIQATPILNITRDFPVRHNQSPDLNELLQKETIPTRVLITPPPKSDEVKPQTKPFEDKTQVVNVTSDFITCHLCQGKVFARYLSQHLRIHIFEYTPSETTKTGSTSVVKTSTTTTTHTSTIHTSGWPNREQYNAIKPTPTPVAPKFKPLERFKFRSLESAYALSSSSKDGRYSDFTLILSQPEQTRTENYGYMSGSSHSYSDWTRFCLHFVYDNKEDYYTISSKLVKRGSYSQYDQEEAIVPDRICFQNEILSEVKKIFLFYQFNPKVAYRLFRKLFKQNIVSERDDRNIMLAQTENIKILNERLNKKPQTYSGHGYHDDHYS